MSVHLITYYMQSTHHHDHEHDENCQCNGDPDYDLVCTIESLGKWAQFTPNGFLVVSELTSEEILEKIRVTVGSKDIIFVTKVNSTDSACTIPECVEWISSNS